MDYIEKRLANINIQEKEKDKDEDEEEEDEDWNAGEAKYLELCNNKEWNEKYDGQWVAVDKDGLVINFPEKQERLFLSAVTRMSILINNYCII